MWSKRPRPGGKGLRCKILVQVRGELVACDRPARRYGQQYEAFWDKGHLQDLGCIDCCRNHATKIQAQGCILTLIDRRLRSGNSMTIAKLGMRRVDVPDARIPWHSRKEK